ncbi:uncharacterized protein EAE97_008154 [Botrytis byssoidea]|uniref:Uncharacterized protein n=1 Tax=Botrytis byssoidea TaxID=139641 RepID=A0A9P5IDJ1_9HELO|nr:uncharacterized protein EAE97_008154 [Botrytis byssoidea]KAF7935247.1 hypothetical protein EAE97_008154 [Botrytis byssoidea]
MYACVARRALTKSAFGIGTYAPAQSAAIPWQSLLLVALGSLLPEARTLFLLMVIMITTSTGFPSAIYKHFFMIVETIKTRPDPMAVNMRNIKVILDKTNF